MNEATIFTEAIGLTTSEEREAYLGRVCADELARARIEKLLHLHEQSDLIVDEPPVEFNDAGGSSLDSVAKEGETIGPYRLLEQIGDGGMGVVYMAEQKKPVRRRVALKIIKAGMDTKQVIARFEAERQALALMEHENIARVLDAGETDSGKPYFVMELVRGVPINEYCQREHLTTTERLSLFIATCRAVQHAHLKGIIHRDIKPSNVMVTLYDGVPVVKMIDFGIAKATNQSLTERTLFTNYSQMIGTPLYMSPEQAELSGLDVDTRSDVYSLGVLLYELLTDTTPFDEERFRTVPYDEMRRIIREEDPPKPSDRISTVGADLETLTDQRKSQVEQRGRLTRGELDWIVIKSIEKDRARRYQSANDLADDVQRHLNGEDVNACPPSTVYKLKKIVWRHRTAVVTGAAFAALLIVGLVATSWLAIQAQDAEALANERLESEVQARKNEAESHRKADKALEAQAKQRKAADLARAEAEKERAAAEAVTQFLQNDLLMQASSYRQPNADVKLRTVVDRAATRLEGRFDDQPLVEAAIRQTLGVVYASLRELTKGEKQYRAALALRVRELEADDPLLQETRFFLAGCLRMQRQYGEAAKLYEQVYTTRKRLLGVDDPSTYASLEALVGTILDSGQHAKGEPYAAETLAMAVRIFGEESNESTRAMSLQSRIYRRLGKPEALAAVVARGRAVRARMDRRGEIPTSTLAAFGQLAIDQYEDEEAVELYRRAIEQERQKGRAENASLLAKLAYAYTKLGRYPEAADICEQVVTRAEERYETNGPGMINSLMNLAEARYRTREFDEAEVAAQRAFDISCRALGKGSPTTLRAQIRLAKTLEPQGKRDVAKEHLEEAWSIGVNELKIDHAMTQKAGYRLTTFLDRQARRYESADKLERALGTRQEELTLRRNTKLFTQPPCNCMCDVATLMMKLERVDESEKLMRECVQLSEASSEDAAVTTRARGLLGEVLTACKKYEEAESVLLECHEALAATPDRDTTEYQQSIERIIKLYEASEQSEKGAVWKEKLGR